MRLRPSATDSIPTHNSTGGKSRRRAPRVPLLGPGNHQHSDCLGNHGSMISGDVQWMTVGSGITRQEMPTGDNTGRMYGFQLWGNLPSSLKMTDPRYQVVKAEEIPTITDDDGTRCGLYPENFGEQEDPLKVWLQSPSISTSVLLPESARPCLLRLFDTLSLTSSRVRANLYCERPSIRAHGKPWLVGHRTTY